MFEQNVGKFAMYLGLMTVAIFLVAFWFFMVRDNLKRNEGYSRYVWTILTVALPIIGSAFYFATVRRELIKKENGEE